MKKRGLVVIEILVVIALVAGLTTMGYTNLVQARRAKNELHARLMLQVFAKAQQHFKEELQSNRDEAEDDKEGEYATLPELIGLKESWSYRQFSFFDAQVGDRHRQMFGEFRPKLGMPEPEKKEQIIDPEAADKEKTKKKKKPTREGPPKFLFESSLYDQKANKLEFDGYAFRVFLPQLASDRKDMTEEEKMKMVVDDVEKFWCAYAWPIHHGRSGSESYFIDFNGKLYKSADPRMSEDLNPQFRAIDAYKGREFTSPVNEEIWTVWVEPKPPAPKRPKKAEVKDGEPKPGEEVAEPAAGEGGEVKEGEPGKPAQVKPAGPTPAEEAEKEKERRQKLIDEAGEGLDLKSDDFE